MSSASEEAMKSLADTLERRRKEAESPFTVLGGILLGLLLLAAMIGIVGPVAAYWNAYVALVLWHWFIPQYAAPSIHTLVGAGIMLHMFVSSPYAVTLAGHKAKAAGTAAILFTVPLMALLVGWIWHWLQWGV